ncbi:MAG: DUF4136 domain-containing protein [Flavobacteriaceae bacterium]|nr:DUF4136 domain-containing protein [Flavobacteriaceae bacterium]RZW48321.1 MAG: DUF4136 domain-containing protein [Flavobacteriaceae bacterium]
MKTKTYFILLSSLIVLGCASTSDVLTDYDPAVNFDNYSTFVICIDDLFVENTNYPNYDNNKVRQLIGDAVESEMLNKGHKTNVFNPELQAGFQLILEQKEVTLTNCEIHDEYSYWKECTIDTEIYTEETLVLYVSDLKMNQIIWQASMTCDMNRSNAKLEGYVKELVQTMYADYPRN